jgi:hypothetical protein
MAQGLLHRPERDIDVPRVVLHGDGPPPTVASTCRPMPLPEAIAISAPAIFQAMPRRFCPVVSAPWTRRLEGRPTAEADPNLPLGFRPLAAG